jgi:hypothetical protein
MLKDFMPQLLRHVPRRSWILGLLVSAVSTIVSDLGTLLSLRLDQNARIAILAAIGATVAAILGAGVCGPPSDSAGRSTAPTGKEQTGEPSSTGLSLPSAPRTETGNWYGVVIAVAIFIVVLALSSLFPALIISALLHPSSYKKGIQITVFAISLIVAIIVYYGKRDEFTFPQTVSFFAATLAPPTLVGIFL